MKIHDNDGSLTKAQPVVIIDGMNFMHRARSGFQLGDYNVVFNTLRNLKPIIEKFSPSRVIFTLEGHPRKRLELLPEYKANRAIDQTTEAGIAKYKSREDFFRQVQVIIDLMEHLPISVMRQPEHEADDLIHNIIKNAATCTDFVVVSSDSDFTQLLQRFSNVKVYNPIAKSFVVAPDYDYVYWKALRGDGSDNVPQIPGIDDVKAVQLLEDPASLRVVFEQHGDHFRRNVSLIRFMDFDAQELAVVESSAPLRDWVHLWARFEEMGFHSMLKEPYRSRFQATFDSLWDTRSDTYDPAKRAKEKKESRDKDAIDLASGSKTIDDLRHENGFLASSHTKVCLDEASSLV